MTDKLDNSAPFDDDQGTRIARKPTGAGAEATKGSQGESSKGNQDHESGYGGKGGKPKKPSDKPSR